MRTLYIDLGLVDGGYTLVHDDRVVGAVTGTDHKDESQLMPVLQRLLQDAGWTMRDLTHIAVVTGPGGFMTLRVAVSMANALAYGLSIPSAGVHASDVWHARTTVNQSQVMGTTATQNAQLETRDIVWLHSTKKTHLFVRGFGAHAVRWPEATLVSIEEAQQIPAETAYVGELIPEHASVLPTLSAMKNAAPLHEVLPRLLQQLQYTNDTILPWYGRGA